MAQQMLWHSFIHHARPNRQKYTCTSSNQKPSNDDAPNVGDQGYGRAEQANETEAKNNILAAELHWPGGDGPTNCQTENSRARHQPVVSV